MLTDKNRIKKIISANGIDVVLQSLIEMIDDSIDIADNIPVWKLKFVDSLEDAYDTYMSRTQDENATDQTSTI